MSVDEETALPVLVLEDEVALRTLIVRTLSFAGFEVLATAAIAEAHQVLADRAIAVAVLDVMLPDGSGFDLAHKLRMEQENVGILLLTARDSLEDRLTGFAFGADDYLTKPFSVAELVARVLALHRRATPLPTSVKIKIADVTLDETNFKVTRAGAEIDLSPTEFKVLRYLMRNADVVVSKEQIIEQVWRYNHVGDVGVVEKFVSQLRRKLGGDLISTVRGFGYTVRSR